MMRCFIIWWYLDNDTLSLYDDTLFLYDDSLLLYDGTLIFYDDTLLLYDHTLSIYDHTLSIYMMILCLCDNTLSYIVSFNIMERKDIVNMFYEITFKD